MKEISIRTTTIQDIEQLKKVDQYFSHHESRHLHSISLGTHFSARDGDTMIGLVIFDYGLFGNAFVWLLIVSSTHHRRGIGSTLIQSCESNCKNNKLFVSTQSSNSNMVGLLNKLGYEECGAVKQLNEDPNDDEIFFYKQLDD